MKKKQLLSLPIPALITDIDVPDEVKGYHKNFIYTAQVDNSTDEDILIVDLYKPSGNHIWRLFQDKGKNYFRCMADNQAISNAGLDYVMDCSYGKIYLCDKQTSAVIFDYINIKRVDDLSALLALAKVHRKVKKDKLEVKYDKIRKSIDNEMLEIRELPKPVFVWIDKSLLKDSRYIFYKYEPKKKMLAYCSHCKSEIIVTSPKHNECGVCPNCNTKAKYIAQGKWGKTNGFEDKKEFYYFQSTRAGFCIRKFEVTRDFFTTRWFGADFRKCGEDSLHEQSRYFYTKSENEDYECGKTFDYGGFRNTGEMRFCESYSTRYLNARCIYPDNLNHIFKNEPRIKYVSLNNLARKLNEINPTELWKDALKNVHVEYLVKLKLYKLARDVVNGGSNCKFIDESKNNIKKALGISKDDLSIIQELNPNGQNLTLYKEIKEIEGKVNIEVLKWVTSNMNSPSCILKMIKYTTIYKAVKYLNEQVGEQKDDEDCYYSDKYSKFINNWCDYINAAIELKMNIKSEFTLFPRNFMQVHDNITAQAIANKKAEQCKKNKQMFTKLFKEYIKKFYFESKEFSICPPKSQEDLIREGTMLHHCVGGYANRYVDKETIILFIRKINEPDDSYYTLELNPNKLSIIQCRGFGNNTQVPFDPAVKKFMEQWKKAKLTKQAQVA